VLTLKVLMMSMLLYLHDMLIVAAPARPMCSASAPLLFTLTLNYLRVYGLRKFWFLFCRLFEVLECHIRCGNDFGDAVKA